MTSLLAHLENLIHAPGCATSYGLNAHTINLSYVYPEFYQALCRADMLYADGASLQLAARLLRKRIPEKVTTTDIWPLACEMATRKGYRFFLLGGEPGLAERARESALRNYPGLDVVGVHHGYFKDRERKVIDLINENRPDILWLGTGEPRQAVWAEKYKNELNVSLVLTCGGMFKIVAGDLRRISGKWRRRGFEWLFRMLQEPGTARRYLLGLPLFGARVLAQCLHCQLQRSSKGLPV
jgi:N-acetylglucosaminyldiphosphoundecaprenol N-acetyl-beta-D-mannosaminyltransferase